MHGLHRLAVAALPALIAVIVTIPASVADAAGELETRTVSTYDVNADGSVRVSIAAQVTNRDPSTQRRSAGRVQFYTAAGFAIHDAAVNLSVRAGNARLPVETRERDDPLRVIAVRFNRDLYFEESIDITLEYELNAVRAAQLLVSPQYTFVPAFGQGTRSLVRITAPPDRQLTIASSNCGRTGDQPVSYACGVSTNEDDYRANGRCAFTAAAPRWDCAFTERDLVVIPFEATSAGLKLAARSSRVKLSAGEVDLKVQYFAGDESWAARVEDVIRRGLPLVEEANGYPYPGSAQIDIIESGYQATHGYEGLASTVGGIHLTPVVDDQTVLHEVAHLWSGIFGSRWLAEGMADYTANVAARRLGLKPETPMDPLPAAPRLEEWGPLRNQLGASRPERDLESAGYSRSLRFVELLAERAGPRQLAAANATLAQERIRGTARTYLDALEDLTGQNFTPLFGEWALASADLDLLPARDAARKNTAALRERTAAAGLSVPANLEQALRAWDFARAERIAATAVSALNQHDQTAARAQAAGIALGPSFAAAFGRGAEQAAVVARDEAAAVDAVSAAFERADGDRSPIMRVGLIGAGLDGREAQVRAALLAGDYKAATMQADAMQQRLDSAERNGAVRLALSGGVLLSLAVVLMVRRVTRRNAY